MVKFYQDLNNFGGNTRMKIAVMADSHDNLDNLSKAIDIANQEKCSHLFHLGDLISPFSARLLKRFHGHVQAVFGNCDGDHLSLQKTFNEFGGLIDKPPLELTLAGKKMVLMHEPYLLQDLLYSSRLNYIFYGHLHKIEHRHTQGTEILNPGEIGGWLHGDPSFYMIDILNNHFEKILLRVSER